MKADATMTLQERQRAWAASRNEPAIERPSCYNRHDYNTQVTSTEFHALTWTTNWRHGCAHWHAGGNAHVRPMCESAGGKQTRWHACSGCTHKDKA